jgi:hypothetical protein
LASDYIFTLFENAEQFGIVFTLLPFGRDLKINIPLTKRFCDRKIEEIDLSVRSLNGLKREGIFTLRQLSDVVMNGDSLSKVKNLGKKSIKEIKTKLLVLAYEDLNDKERIEFWCKFLELNSSQIMYKNGGYNND